MHIITVLRDYLGMTQQALAKKADITQADLSEIETMEPYGSIVKYRRLSGVLGVPVHALVNNDFTRIPMSFFEVHSRAPYLDGPDSGRGLIGRAGEEEVLRMERERLEAVHPVLTRLVIPYFKLRRTSPGYDILSFDDDGKPFCIEVKTTQQGEDMDFRLTSHEFEVAKKRTEKGERYFVYRFTGWGTPTQKLHIIPFRTMLDGNRIIPCQYVCSMKDRTTELCGIAFHRRARGLTQEDLAAQLGILPQHLCRYEKGGRSCPVTLYRKISDLLEVSIDDLLSTYPVAALGGYGE